MDQKPALEDYILGQFRSGLTPEEISQQLRTAGWDESAIADGFKAAQAAMAPPPTEPAAASPQGAVKYQATSQKRGRLKTAWLLLKQSLKILRHNRQLLRYPLMGGILSTLLAIVFVLIFILGRDTLTYETVNAFGETDWYLTAPGYALMFVAYVVVYFAIFIYNAGLAAHTLDIFRGKSGDYQDYMKVAWGKKLPIFVYALITSTVGLILRAIEERSRWLGIIVARLLGALWAFANLFTIPILVENDISTPAAIKQSTKLFISRWGENIAARIGFGGLAFFVYLLVLFPVFIALFVIGSFAGTAGLIAVLALMLIAIFAFAVIETAASNVLSTALYFYAQYGQVPAAYDADMLNAVFIPKKAKKGEQPVAKN